MAGANRRVTVMMAVLTLACRATAQASGALSVQEAIGRALADHPALKTAKARIEAASAAHRALWEAYAPQVVVFGGAQHNTVSGGSTTTTTPGLLGSTTAGTQPFSQKGTPAP